MHVFAQFRGYAWSDGTPGLRFLYPDSEALLEALPEILSGAGLQPMPLVLHGRSLGTACAIHLARLAPEPAGLVVEALGPIGRCVAGASRV